MIDTAGQGLAMGVVVMLFGVICFLAGNVWGEKDKK